MTSLLRSNLRLVAATFCAISAAASLAAADSVKPLHSGPFFMNEVNISASPFGYDYVLTNGYYHFQVGWIEPLSESSRGLFGETYFETDGNLNVSPFTSDFGTTFNFKPIRYLEFGLSYNRLIFHNSMVSFEHADTTPLPKTEYLPENILSVTNSPGGADIFAYQANFTYNLGPTQLYLFAMRTQWDVDAKGKDFVYEYTSDLLIRTRDRVNFLEGCFNIDTRPWSLFKDFSFTGFVVRDQYWWTTQTQLEKDLISAGITGIRTGRNPELQRRGLDIEVGYWLLHHQLPKNDFAKSLQLLLDWKWNIQFLKI